METVARSVSRPSDTTIERQDKARLFVFHLFAFIITVTVSVIVIFEGEGPGSRGFLTSALGLAVVLLIIALGVQVSVKAFVPSFLMSTLTLEAVAVWCSTALGATRQGSFLLFLAGVLPGLGLILLPNHPHHPYYVAGQFLLVIVAVITIVILQSLDAVATTPLADAEFWAILFVVLLGLIGGVLALARAEKQRSAEHRRIWESQKHLEERMAFALDQVRQPLNSLIALAATSAYPPHPSVIVAATTLQQAVDDVQTVIGFNVSYINNQPFVIRQVVQNALTEMQKFLRAEKSGGGNRNESKSRRLAGGGGKKSGSLIGVHIDENVPVLMRGDSRRLYEMILECLFNASRRTVSVLFFYVTAMPGPKLAILIGDDGRTVTAEKKNVLLRGTPQNEGSASGAKLGPEGSNIGKEKGLARVFRLCQMMKGSFDIQSIQGTAKPAEMLGLRAEGTYNVQTILLPLTGVSQLPLSLRRAELGGESAEEAESKAGGGGNVDGDDDDDKSSKKKKSKKKKSGGDDDDDDDDDNDISTDEDALDPVFIGEIQRDLARKKKSLRQLLLEEFPSALVPNRHENDDDANVEIKGGEVEGGSQHSTVASKRSQQMSQRQARAGDRGLQQLLQSSPMQPSPSSYMGTGLPDNEQPLLHLPTMFRNGEPARSEQHPMDLSSIHAQGQSPPNSYPVPIGDAHNRRTFLGSGQWWPPG